MPSLPPYPSYRDSGILWLGQIPAHWEVKRIKHIVLLNSETLPETTDPDYIIQYLDIGNVDEVEGIGTVQEFRFENAPSRARRIVRAGDTIISTVRTYLKAVAFFEKPSDNQIVSTGFAVLRPQLNVFPKYLSWLVQSKPFVERVVAHSVGVGYPAINPSELASLPAWLPPLPEQRTIAAYLDRQTAKIYALIAKKQRLLALLAKQRAALISQAVTKGLNPDVKMKDSGVDWLGDIPAHWEIKRVKYVANLNMGQSPSSDEYNLEGVGRPFLQGNAEFGENHPIPKYFCDAARKFALVGDYLLSVRAPVGALNLADQEYGIGRGLCAIRAKAELLDHRFTWYLLETSRKQLDFVATGSTYEAVSTDQVGNAISVVPPLSEQTAIAAYLDHQTAKIDALTTNVESAIERLREYRSALISSAVTGKIKVEGLP
jgi:type I restriction enzyme S subunit